MNMGDERLEIVVLEAAIVPHACYNLFGRSDGAWGLVGKVIGSGIALLGVAR